MKEVLGTTQLTVVRTLYVTHQAGNVTLGECERGGVDFTQAEIAAVTGWGTFAGNFKNAIVAKATA